MIGLGLHSRSGALLYDADSLAFFARAGVTDPVVKRRHDRIVRHLKYLGRWSGLYHWIGYDAGVYHDAGGGVLVPPTIGETVRLVLNRKGDYAHAEQTTGVSQPLYAADGLVFDGVDDYLSLTSVAGLLRNVSGGAILGVVKFEDSGEVRNIAGINGGTGLLRLAIRANDTKLYRIGGRRLDADGVQYRDYGGGNVITDQWTTFSGIARYSTASISLLLDDAVLTTGPLFSAGNTSDTDPTSALIGAVYALNGLASFMYGSLKHVMVFNVAPSDSDMLALHAMLKEVYGY